MVFWNCRTIKEDERLFRQKDFVEVSVKYGWNKLPKISVLYPPVTFKKRMFIQLKKQAPIFAMKSGRVIELGKEGELDQTKSYKRSLGNYLFIESKDGSIIRYEHLSKLKVKLGDFVEEGKCIGISGNSGLMVVNGIGVRVVQGDSIVDPNIYLHLPDSVLTKRK